MTLMTIFFHVLVTNYRFVHTYLSTRVSCRRRRCSSVWFGSPKSNLIFHPPN
ncbi:hypothetical protein LINGRAHAP2_LOCUS23844 [Linum grandiflorum]